MQQYPAPASTLTRITSENATASSVIGLTHDTTAIEVAAVGQGAAIRWVTAGDTQASVVTIAGTTANFDHVITTGTVRRFVVPVVTQGTSQASVQGINRAEGLYPRVAYRSFGIGSVMLSEF